MVDMSPEAVSQRLRMMDELWELSVALMNSKEVPSEQRLVEQDSAQPKGDGDASQNRKR